MVRNVRERKFLATIISLSSGLYRAIIESLKPTTVAAVAVETINVLAI